MRLMIVDDSKAMRMIVRRTLRQAGFEGECLEATNGAEALATAKSEPLDFIISDWNMPEMDGIALLKALRSAGITTGFGFVTSESTPQMRELAEDAGARFVISKPFTADDLSGALSGAGV